MRAFKLHTLLIVVAVVAVLGVALGIVLTLSFRPKPSAAPRVAQSKVKEQWQCPMHPAIIRDQPGDCPICGMKLVKMASDEPQSEAKEQTEGLATVRIDPTRQQLIGLKTVHVERGEIGGMWRTVGRVAIDETRVRHINVKVSGFVEHLHVDFIGRPVKKGDPLFTIYSPELYAAQEEYLLALRTQKELARGGVLAQSGDDLLTSAKKKLELWDIPKAELERLEKTGRASKNLTLYSPISGVVVKKDAVQGMKLDAGAMPYEIVDLSSVWVLADIYESELRFMKVGMPASLSLKAFPERTFKGKVAFIDPMLDPSTRTVKVRIAFANPTGELRPEMFGEVTLSSSSRIALRIPSDALIDSGTKHVVFVALGDGKFAPREVKVGNEAAGYTEIAEGLAEHDEIVTRANFLIDSESRLRASLNALDGSPSEPSARAGHEGH
jgi:Cu(I)/Ag(I) efflux system membrane fusion protein